FFFQAEDGIRDLIVTGVQTCALPISFASRFAAQGVRYLDAPVTGGQKGSVEATLSFMVGGDAADLERARPWLLTMGKKIIHCGQIGRASCRERGEVRVEAGGG